VNQTVELKAGSGPSLVSLIRKISDQTSPDYAGWLNGAFPARAEDLGRPLPHVRRIIPPLDMRD
jgi:hypothetical protein